MSGAETTAAPNQPRANGDPEVLVVPSFMNNPNMEFFMEVTPESITIDSLETTVVTSGAQADNGKSRNISCPLCYHFQHNN